MKDHNLRSKKSAWIILTICIVIMVTAIFLFEKGEALGKVIAN